MNIGIIVFPGSNCDRDVRWATQGCLGISTSFIWHETTDLDRYDAIVLPGGFSYGDYLRCGAIARFAPVLSSLISFVDKGGRVLGICNGAQILVESGLVPGCKDNTPCVALTDNKRIKNNLVVGVGYYNTWTNLKMSSNPNRSAFTRHLKTNDFIRVPFAHGEGRFLVPEHLLNEMIKN